MNQSNDALFSTSRRRFLAHAGAVSLVGVGATLATVRDVQAADYKAIVVVFLAGGHDGNNMLIPTDGAYGDYAKARPSLALPRDNLVPLSATHIGHRFALSPALRPLANLFEQKRLAVVANVGALIEPTTMAQVKARTAKLPPFLGSHSEQEDWMKGWKGDEERTGWAGRAMDLMPAELKTRQPLISFTSNYLAVVGNNTPLSLNTNGGNTNWGRANLDNPDDSMTRRIEWASRLQSTHAYKAEFSRSLRTAMLDTQEFGRGQRFGPEPAGAFFQSAFTSLPNDLRLIARHIPYSKSVGARRQVYLVQDGGYDTHSGQLNAADGNNAGLEARLDVVSRSLVALDDSLKALGMDGEVLTLVISEFGRTLDPAAGAGSDHAWGNHWFAMGGAVRGGMVYGETFPLLQTGGPDDTSMWQPYRGQWLPQFSSDQFMADALRWMGLTPEQAVSVMPNLANFSRRTVGYI